MLMNKIDILAEKIPYFKKWTIGRRVNKYFHKYFDDIHGKNVLEIGCGNGEGAVVIKKYFSPTKIIATDFDSNLISFAKRNIKEPTINFEQQDATSLKYKNNQFDAVFSFKVIHHITNWEDCLKEIYRVLKIGGEFFIIEDSSESFNTPWGKMLKMATVHPYKTMYGRQEFVNTLKKISFTIINIVSSKQYFVIVAKK